MKLFAIILCISILALSCISCEDFELADNSEIAIEQIITKDNSHQDNDNCSPLCNCNCCGQLIIINLKVAQLTNPKPVHNREKIASYRNCFPTNYAKNIWQPPKLITEFLS
ncbi:hypothetical protein QWY86_06385 [Pedobacter aquatilis]|uniref:DUF6660 family protein n=1 Tax=Pedobacter aquatilis TaxID=351343 RepID=UPI0025B2D757|nr:DUF6660 family protein [Pedobacter aquatilis]MDN3586287.1 hypothetical protein [Pedobacter aquatilis]